jgi:hypothetical protein
VAALGLVHVVGRHEQGRARVGELEEFFPEVAPRFGIDRAGRLVEEQQFGFVDDRAGEREALLLAAAHRAGELALAIGEMVLLDQFVDAPLRARARQRLHVGEEFEVLAHGQVLEQRELLRHVADARAQLLGLRGHRQPEHVDLPFARREQAAEHADRGRLAGTVRTEETVDIAARHREVDVVDSDERAETLGQAVRADREIGVAGRVHFPAPPNSARIGRPAGSAAASLPSATSAR